MTTIDLDATRDGLEAAVREAAEAIIAVVEGGQMRVRHKRGGPVTDADHAADAVLSRVLMPLIPGAHWLSEESKQEAPLIHGEPTWIVDPLDGTREFVEGIPEYGVSVGLFLDDALVLGAVALPEEGVVFSGLIDGDRREARRNGATLAALRVGGIGRVVVSRHDYEWRRIQRHIPWDVYGCGSSAVKLAHASDGTADVYFSTRPRSLWDIAGGVAVLRAAGGEVLGVDGEALILSPQTRGVPPFVAGRLDACREMLRLVAG